MEGDRGHHRRRLAADGWVDAGFATAFLGVMAVLVWPTLMRWREVPWPVSLGAMAAVAASAVGDRGFWPRLRVCVLWVSLWIWLGGVALHATGARWETVTQWTFVGLCAALAVWVRRRA